MVFPKNSGGNAGLMESVGGRAIILLHLEDQNYDEIASITGLTRSNVSVRLVRIKRALKDYLHRNQ